jgi:hypothetical protein
LCSPHEPKADAHWQLDPFCVSGDLVKIRALCCITIVAGLMPLSGLAASPAAAEGTLDIADGILYDDCHDQQLHYDLSYPGASEWEIDGTVYTPGGDESGGIFAYGSGDTAAGSDTFLVCSFEGAGTWYAEATVTWYDDELNELATDDLSTEFRVRRQPTRTGVKINDTRPRRGQVIRLAVASKDLQPRGWTANSYALVAINAKCDGQPWHRVRGSKQYTDQHGRVAGRWRWNVKRQCRVRAVTFRDDNAAKSYSRIKIWRTQRAAAGHRPTAETGASASLGGIA